MIARTRSYGSSTHTMWRLDDNSGRLPPRLVHVAAEHAGHAVMRDDDGQQRQRRVEQCRGAIDHRAHGRVDRANHRVRRDERAEPVREVNDLGGGNAGKQVLRAAREARDLVRKHRPADKYVVVLGGQTIERDRHVLIEASAGDIGNVARGDRPEAVRMWRGRPNGD